MRTTRTTSVDGVLLSKDEKTLVLYPERNNANGSYTVPSTVTRIDTLAFQNSRIASINLSNVQRIDGRYTFYGSSIRSLTIPATMKYIHGEALTCPNITSISVASGKYEL